MKTVPLAPREQVRRTFRRSAIAGVTLCVLWAGLTAWFLGGGGSFRLVEPQEQVEAPKAAGSVLTSPLDELRVGFLTLQRDLAAYPDTVLIPVGTAARVNGVPMAMASFETRDGPDTVMAHYARHFNARSWWWLNTDQLGAQGFVYPAMTATDPTSHFQYSVMVMPHQEGSTVMLSVADMDRAVPEEEEDPRDLPRFPDTQPFVLASQGPEQPLVVVAFETQASETELKAFYRKAMNERGYRLVSDPDAQGEGPQLRFEDDHDQWMLAVASKEGKRLVTAQRTPKEIP